MPYQSPRNFVISLWAAPTEYSWIFICFGGCGRGGLCHVVSCQVANTRKSGTKYGKTQVSGEK